MTGSSEESSALISALPSGMVAVLGLDVSAAADALLVLVDPLRKRHTSRTPWNLESWNRFIAATQAASVR